MHTIGLRSSFFAALLLLAALCASAQLPMRVEVSAVQPDGGILIAGQSSAPASEKRLTIARFHDDGTRDATFGSGGSIEFLADSATVTEFRATAMTVAADGKIVIATVRDGQVALVRLESGGQPDILFGNLAPGLALDELSTSGQRVNALIALGGGAVMAVGSYRGPETLGLWNAAIYRYDAQGSRDLAFAPRGERLHALSAGDNELRAALALSGDALVATGYAHDGVIRNFVIAKFLPSGDLDPGFGTGGRTTKQPVPGYASEAFAITRDSLYGNFVVVGRTTVWQPFSYFAIAMFTPAGQPDPSFLANAFSFLSEMHGTALSVATIPGSSDLLIAGTAVNAERGKFLFTVQRFDIAYPGWSRWGPYVRPYPIDGGYSMAGAYPDASGQFVVVGTHAAAEGDFAFRARHFLDDGQFDTDFPAEGADATPNYFNFSGESFANPAFTYRSDILRIAGIDVPIPIAIEGGQYSIGCDGTRTSAAGMILNGQTVCVYNTSATTPDTVTSAILTVGGLQASYDVRTGHASDTIITVKPANPSVATVKFDYKYGSYPGSPWSFECRLDEAPFATCPSYNGITYANLPEGTHTFEVRTVGPWGADPTPASYTWATIRVSETILDFVPVIMPTGPNVSYAFSSPNPGATFQCRMDSAAFLACASPKSYSGLTTGFHTFQVRAVTVAGPDPTPAAHHVLVDATPPDTRITGGPPGNTGAPFAIFTFDATEPGATFECKLDLDAFRPCTSPQIYEGLARTTHTFKVRAMDALGNVDATPASASWTVR